MQIKKNLKESKLIIHDKFYKKSKILIQIKIPKSKCMRLYSPKSKYAEMKFPRLYLPKKTKDKRTQLSIKSNEAIPKWPE